MKRTALNEVHQQLGARMVPFAGWEMPVQYPAGLLAEHQCVRQNVGLFDVSHMGEFRVAGRGAEAALNALLTSDVSTLSLGAAQYGLLCADDGGILDDVIVYRESQDAFLICVNAGNTEKDARWFRERLPGADRLFTDLSAFYAQIAVQGPRSAELLAKVCASDVSRIAYYHFMEAKILGVPALVSRTGYTGERGYEIYLEASHAPAIWMGLLEQGRMLGVLPCGLGARDTLRVEVGFSLYGQDMSEATHPYESGLGWAVDEKKASTFVGQEALRAIREKGQYDRLTGFVSDKGAVPRAGAVIYAIEEGGEPIGVVTSGVPSPTLALRIGFCRVPQAFARPGTDLWVDVRGKRVKITTQHRVFYKRGSAREG